jgi:hypothetical protein
MKNRRLTPTSLRSSGERGEHLSFCLRLAVLADGLQLALPGQMRTDECQAVGVNRILQGASRILRCGVVNKFLGFLEGWTTNVQGSVALCGEKLKSWDLK